MINELRDIMLTSCVYCMSYELLLFARVTSYLLHTKLQIFVYCISYELSFAYELRVTGY